MDEKQLRRAERRHALWRVGEALRDCLAAVVVLGALAAGAFALGLLAWAVGQL